MLPPSLRLPTIAGLINPRSKRKLGWWYEAGIAPTNKVMHKPQMLWVIYTILAMAYNKITNKLDIGMNKRQNRAIKTQKKRLKHLTHPT